MPSKKKYTTKSHLKQYSIGLLLLCSVSLFSVGFSTWYTGANSSKEGTVNIEIADTKELEGVFEIQTPNMFSYNEYGIIRDETFLSDGYIYFPILINVNATNFSSIKNTDDDINLALSISNTGNVNFLSETYLKATSEIINSVTYSVSATSFSTTCDSIAIWQRNNNTVDISVQIANLDDYAENGKIYLNSALHFSFADFSDVYQDLVHYGISFSISVRAITI